MQKMNNRSIFMYLFSLCFCIHSTKLESFYKQETVDIVGMIKNIYSWCDHIYDWLYLKFVKSVRVSSLRISLFSFRCWMDWTTLYSFKNLIWWLCQLSFSSCFVNSHCIIWNEKKKKDYYNGRYTRTWTNII